MATAACAGELWGRGTKHWQPVPRLHKPFALVATSPPYLPPWSLIPMEAKQPPSSRFAGALLPQASATKPGAKRLVIKQYAEKPKLPETFDADTWARLSGNKAYLPNRNNLIISRSRRCSSAAEAREPFL